jgi:type I restriction enzyme, R subunit
MPITPEDRARENIDKLLTGAGWMVQDKRSTNLSAGRGVAVREFPLKSGHGEADYLLFVDGAPLGVVEAKKEGDTLTGVELQTTKYSEGVPDNLTTPRRPLPFQYQSTGVETRFTNLLCVVGADCQYFLCLDLHRHAKERHRINALMALWTKLQEVA